MGKMKEIAQIPVKWYPFIRLRDILNDKEYLKFLKIFGYTPYTLPVEEVMQWSIDEDNPIELIHKVNNTLLVMGFNVKDTIYLELSP